MDGSGREFDLFWFTAELKKLIHKTSDVIDVVPEK